MMAASRYYCKVVVKLGAQAPTAGQMVVGKLGGGANVYDAVVTVGGRVRVGEPLQDDAVHAAVAGAGGGSS